MMIYATGVTGASFWYFFAITFNKVPEDNIQNSNLILGFLIGSAISTFLGYYFGMSQSVRRDDKLPPPTEFSRTTTRTESGADTKE
jgi:ABC-type nitrate/sulfonate/bicarbonate transport system permease component